MTSEPRAPFEPRPGALEADSGQGKKLLNLCSPLPCMIPLQPLGYEVPSKTLLSYSELWKSSLRAGGSGGGGGFNFMAAVTIYRFWSPEK